MNKSKLGLSVGLTAVLMCLTGWFAGYVAAIVVAGYILIFEENKFLKQTAVNVLGLMFAFSLCSVAIIVIPSLWEIIESTVSMFEYFYVDELHRVFNILQDILSVVRTIAFVGITLLAFNEKSVKIPVIDNMFED